MKKTMKKRKALIFTLSIAMVACLGTYSFSYAESSQDKLNKINEEKEYVKGDMEELAGQIEDQQAEVDDLQAKVDAKQADLDATQANIDQIQADMTARQDGLDNRLRTMYKNGSVGYLDILLGSNSVTEFLSNLEMVQKIYKGDQETLNTLKDQQSQLEEQQAKLKEEKSTLDSQKAEVDEKQAALQENQDALQSKLDELEAEAEAISSEIAASQDKDLIYTGGVFQWPCNGQTITSWFGNRPYPGAGGSTDHGGIDIAAGHGTPIYAAESGKVIMASWYGGYGNCIVIDHGSGISTLYGHASGYAVSNGQTVSRGQVIGYIGSTGNSTGPHLHFEVRINGTRVDPMSYLN